MFEKIFHIKALQSDIKTEVLAGFTTFLTMSYIIFVNPMIISQAGIDIGAAFVATCLAAAFGTLLMGLYANYPIALAPGMGINAYFTYGVVLGLGVSWQTGLGIVFYSGLLFFIICLFRTRQWIINAIPESLKSAIAAGIGLFLLIIGLENAHIIIDHPKTLVTFGDVTSPTVFLAILGFFIIILLDRLKIPGAILLGILSISVLGNIFDHNEWQGFVSSPPSILPTFMQLDFACILDISLITVIFAFFLVDMFDSVGTFIGVTKHTNLVDKSGKLSRMKQALISDSSATMFGSLLGTSSTTSYIESATGIRTGGRTGLTAVVVTALFLVALFLSPLAQSIPAYATAPALMFVGFLMCRSLKNIHWDDMSDYIPCLITAISMPFTYSIATGIGLGFISYVLLKLIYSESKKLSPVTCFIAGLFLIRFIMGQG